MMRVLFKRLIGVGDWLPNSIKANNAKAFEVSLCQSNDSRAESKEVMDR